MSEVTQFEPKIIAYVCNWCTYLGADLAGTTRLEYPANVRIVRLPCTGRIDFNLLIKAFEVGADAVLVSGCHPGDCHYTAGNYHARRRWMLFRDLLDTLGFDLRRIHFTWISAAEGRKWQEEITRITDETRELGPYRELYQKNGFRRPAAPPPPPKPPKPAKSTMAAQEQQLRETCTRLLTDGTVQVVIGYGAGGPVFIRRAEDVGKLVWNTDCQANLTTYLKRKEIKRLGKAAVVVKGCDERGLVILEKESQIDRATLRVIGMACDGVGEPKCDDCNVRQPRFADEIIDEARVLMPDVAPGFRPAPGLPVVPGIGPASAGRSPALPLPWRRAAAQRPQPLDDLMKMSPAERMSFWAREFERCVKCYARTAGVPTLLLRAMHCGQEPASGHRHLRHPQGKLCLAHHAGLPSGGPLRGLR